MIRQLTAYCSRDVRVADISGKADLSAQRSAHPDIVYNAALSFVMNRDTKRVIFKQAHSNGEA